VLVRGARLAPGTFVVKSVWEHASIGLDEDSVVECADALALAAELARRLPSLGGSGFAEAYVEGREFNLSLLAGEGGPSVLAPAEIDFQGYGPEKRRVVGYRAKWDPASFEYHHTPRRFAFPASDCALLDELAALARAAWELFGLSGWARVDFRVDAAGRPWILEVNTNPCLSPDAGFAAALAEEGLTLADALARILADVPGAARSDPTRCSASDRSATTRCP
jgi:D-alanine-D-alanine ligase